MTREADSSIRFLAAVMKIEELGWLVAFLESSRKADPWRDGGAWKA